MTTVVACRAIYPRQTFRGSVVTFRRYLSLASLLYVSVTRCLSMVYSLRTTSAISTPDPVYSKLCLLYLWLSYMYIVYTYAPSGITKKTIGNIIVIFALRFLSTIYTFTLDIIRCVTFFRTADVSISAVGEMRIWMSSLRQIIAPIPP